MSVAIFTKFIPATNTKPSRVKAYTAWNGNVHSRNRTIAWDHGLDDKGNHKAVAELLIRQLAWNGVWHMGDADDKYVFVRVDGVRNEPAFVI